MAADPKRNPDQVRRDIAAEQEQLRNAVFNLRVKIERILLRIGAKIATVVAAVFAVGAVLAVIRLLRRWKR